MSSPGTNDPARAAALRRRRRARWAGLLVVAGLLGLAIFISSSSGDTQESEEAQSTPEPSKPPTVACGGEEPPTYERLTYDKRPPFDLEPKTDYRAVIETSCGSIEIDLLEDDAPQTVNNFVFLAREGFYDGLTFHRVEQNSIIQGGDPEGTGRGGPGYTIPDEYPRGPDEYVFGTVGMANEGPGTAGSQFFVVVHDPDPDPNEIFEQCNASESTCLERKREAQKDARVDEPAGYRPDYAIFGRVDPEDDESVATLLEIAKQETEIGNDPSIATQPVLPIFIESIEILET